LESIISIFANFQLIFDCLCQASTMEVMKFAEQSDSKTKNK